MPFTTMPGHMKRTDRVIFRMTPTEVKRVCKAMRVSKHRSVSDFCRAAALELAGLYLDKPAVNARGQPDHEPDNLA